MGGGGGRPRRRLGRGAHPADRKGQARSTDLDTIHWLDTEEGTPGRYGKRREEREEKKRKTERERDRYRGLDWYRRRGQQPRWEGRKEERGERG